MKFDIVVGNPPYGGKGNPLYMRITKVIYDNFLSDNGIMSIVNPTSLVDNKYTGNQNYENLKKEYGKLKLKDFYYSDYMRDVFSDAEIGNGIAIFVYSKNGSLTLFDDEIKVRRFGDDYMKDIEIVGLVSNKPMIGDYSGFESFNASEKDKTKEFPKGVFYSVMAYNRGNTDKKTGGKKWDWTTLQSEEYIKVKDELPCMGMNFVSFGHDYDSAKEFIKWTCTDFINWLVLFYKYQMTNNSVMFRKLPQPPSNGDYSDESLCEYFGLTKEQMDYIHEKVKDYGWKVYFKCTEHELLNRIDYMNDHTVHDDDE